MLYIFKLYLKDVFEKLCWDLLLTYLSDRSIITCCIAYFLSIFSPSRSSGG